MVNFTVQQVENPSGIVHFYGQGLDTDVGYTITDDLISNAVDLFYSLMHQDQAALSLCGGDISLFKLQIRAMIKAAVLDGEFYSATDENGRLLGYTIWMPPGQEMFSTEEQRALGFNEFVSRLPPAGMDYFKNTYLVHFPAFVNQNLGLTGKKDSWWLHNAAIVPEYQRKGITRALVNLVKDKAKAKGEMLATSTTTDSNVAVYVGLGFHHHGTLMMPSPWGEWPLHVFSLDTSKME